MRLSDLNWINYSERHDMLLLPREAGVYIVAVDSRIIYVGCADSIWGRLYCHERLKTHPDLARSIITYIRIRDRKLRDRTEAALIVLYRPLLNRRHNQPNNGAFRKWSRAFTKAGTELAQAVRAGV